VLCELKNESVDPFGGDLVVGLGSWSLLLSRSQVQFPIVPISVSKSIQSFALALNEVPAGGQ